VFHHTSVTFQHSLCLTPHNDTIIHIIFTIVGGVGKYLVLLGKNLSKINLVQHFFCLIMTPKIKSIIIVLSVNFRLASYVFKLIKVINANETSFFGGRFNISL